MVSGFTACLRRTALRATSSILHRPLCLDAIGAKPDTIDGETLLRTLMAWQRGDPRVCPMTVPSSRVRRTAVASRANATLPRERIRHTNRIRGLLFGQGVTNYIRCTGTAEKV